VTLLAQTLERSSHITKQVIEAQFDHVINALRRIDDLIGSKDLRPLVLGRFNYVNTLISGAPREPLRSYLFSSAAQAAQLAGWLSYDMNLPHEARRYYKVAHQFAQEAGDDPLVGYIFGCQGVLETYEGDAGAGLQLAEEALLCKDLTATTRSWLFRVEALSLATKGEITQCEAALDRAEIEIAKSDPPNDPPWIYHFNDSQLAGQKGACYVRLKLPQKAKEALRKALDGLDKKSFVRDRVLHLTHLACAYALEGEIEEACDRALEALDIAILTQSARERKRIKSFRQYLKPFQETVAVKRFDERFQTAAKLAA
jgi:tetratricopeptide (TPR) repeat protein